jgi:phosphatidylglycerophosphate synthase
LPNRCSINFHILHSHFAILIYLLLSYFKKFRIIAIGLLLHMLTDFIDCLLMN